MILTSKVGVVTIRSPFFTLHFISHSPFCCSPDVLASRSPLSALSRSTLHYLLFYYHTLSSPSLACSLSLLLNMHTCRVPRRWWQHFAKKLEIMLLNQGRCDQDRRQTLLDQDCRDEDCRQDRHAIVIMLNTYLHIYIHDP